jgi:peptidoglycan biosynthesis protein MviN/MurJ (putative lipid II flippase)
MASLGTPAFAQIWAPWHDKITNFHLISDYFQPALGGVTSTSGALACLLTYGAMHSKGTHARQRVLAVSAAGFVLSLFICTAFQYSVGLVWFPDPLRTVLLWCIWIVVYIVMFVSLGVLMTTGTISVQGKRGKK